MSWLFDPGLSRDKELLDTLKCHLVADTKVLISATTCTCRAGSYTPCMVLDYRGSLYGAGCRPISSRPESFVKVRSGPWS